MASLPISHLKLSVLEVHGWCALSSGTQLRGRVARGVAGLDSTITIARAGARRRVAAGSSARAARGRLTTP